MYISTLINHEISYFCYLTRQRLELLTKKRMALFTYVNEISLQVKLKDLPPHSMIHPCESVPYTS